MVLWKALGLDKEPVGSAIKHYVRVKRGKGFWKKRYGFLRIKSEITNYHLIMRADHHFSMPTVL